MGHIFWVKSVAYSPDGRHIISGSADRTIRIWDAETCAVVGKPLEGHTDRVLSVAYSPDGRYIISGSDDRTIRVWDTKTCTVADNHLEGLPYPVHSITYFSDGQHIVSGHHVNSTTSVPDAFPYVSTQTPSCNPMHHVFCAKPDLDGWVRDSEGGLLYWVPHDCRRSVHSPALLTIPRTSRNRSIALDFDNFAFGTSWTQILKSAPS